MRRSTQPLVKQLAEAAHKKKAYDPQMPKGARKQLLKELEEQEAMEAAKKAGIVIPKQETKLVESKLVDQDAMKRVLASAEQRKKERVKDKIIVLRRKNLGRGALNVSLAFNPIPNLPLFDTVRQANLWIRIEQDSKYDFDPQDPESEKYIKPSVRVEEDRKWAFEIRDSFTEKTTYQKWVWNEHEGWHGTTWDKYDKTFYRDPAGALNRTIPRTFGSKNEDISWDVGSNV